MSTAEITGVGRVVARYETFGEIRFRIDVVEKNRKRGLVGGTIEAAPGVISALHDVGECAIELGSVLGWFGFVVTNVPRGENKLTGWLRNP